MLLNSYSGYHFFLVLQFIVTGMLIIRFDTKRYTISNMHKERRTARFLGWLNVVLGVAIFAANWVYRQWFI
ncbi:CLC_0170 family protein [Paenibacillus tarimensis]